MSPNHRTANPKRTGQVVSDRGLGRDASVSPAAAQEWLSLLEDCFLIKLLPCSTIGTACPLRP